MRRALLLACAVSALACAQPEPPAGVVLVAIDTLRADRVGAYGHDRDTTPVIDGLAAAGALIERTHAPVGSTTPSHASIFTGRHPLSHGVTANGLTLDDSLPHLAELAASQGWRCLLYTSPSPRDQRGSRMPSSA